MSSSTGLWAMSMRSVSPRMPTVEYARSERSVAKSSQAATNSRLSSARASASRRCQAGSSLKKVNLANVRSGIVFGIAIVPMLAAATLVLGPSTAAAQPGPRDPGRVVIAVLPYGTTVEQIAENEELAPGVVSAGLGAVPVAQTFLDVSQGNRANE